ncbi:MAG: hypothetical protein HZA78_09240 [Candidatus Schekmanbacteria bacterium]|nr:hypothetical protein [Candidatus Schekmanbacteria bacterium]
MNKETPLYFADIPVYRIQEEEYYKKRENYIDKMMYGKTSELRERNKSFYERNIDNRIYFEDHLEKQYGGPWDFNEIIGYVRLHFLGFQVRGELFMVDKKRITRTRKKIFLFRTGKVVSETVFSTYSSNEEIFNAILRYLSNTKKELKPRFMDSASFEFMGKFIDWKNLLNEYYTP